MKSEGLYSLTFTLRQAEHCNQGGLSKDKSQRTFASKTVFCTTIYRRYPELNAYLTVIYISDISLQVKQTVNPVHLLQKTIGYTPIMQAPWGVIRLPTDVLRGSSGVPAPTNTLNRTSSFRTPPLLYNQSIVRFT